MFRDKRLAFRDWRLALSSQRSAISNQRSAISGQRSAISGQQSAVSNQQSAISNQQSAVSNQRSEPSQKTKCFVGARYTSPLTQKFTDSYSTLNPQSTLSTQHLALSTQHLALKSQSSALLTFNFLLSSSSFLLFTFNFFLLLAFGTVAIAQDTVHHTWEVYLERNVDGNNTDRLIFIDVLTGDETQVEVTGERYTPAGDKILFFDYVNQWVMTAAPDGGIRHHPFIHLDGDGRRVDWVISPDNRRIAWTQTYGTPDQLTTITQVATLEGAEINEVLRDGPKDGIRALPVGFDVDNQVLYMDAYPDALGRFVAYAQYAGLFRVNLATREPAALPDEPACFCGAGLHAGRFLRLTLTPDLVGFDVQVHDLVSGTQQTIPAFRLNNYNQAGDILIAPDGTQAVYALSRLQNFGTPQQTVETVFMLVDLLAFTQRPLTDPITTYVHPVKWTEENTAILFTSPQLNGTWKIALADGNLDKVAQTAYVGVLTD